MENISVEELRKIIGNINIIDVRGRENFNNGHIGNAINVPFNELLINSDKYIIKNKVYYIYCQRGTRSVKLCQILRNKGYRVVNVLGGYQAWILLK